MSFLLDDGIGGIQHNSSEKTGELGEDFHLYSCAMDGLPHVIEHVEMFESEKLLADLDAVFAQASRECGSEGLLLSIRSQPEGNWQMAENDRSRKRQATSHLRDTKTCVASGAEEGGG